MRNLAVIEGSRGGAVLAGVYLHHTHARVLAETSWRTLMTNSAKLVNIIAGYATSPSWRR